MDDSTAFTLLLLIPVFIMGYRLGWSEHVREIKRPRDKRGRFT